MFEGYTLEAQRQFEEARGWKPSYSALTYCTAEAVLMRKPSSGVGDLIDTEILIATRVSGAPDCVGRVQSKWGGYVKPTDQTPLHSMQRTLQEMFGWSADQIGLKFAGILGPWMYKSTLALEGERQLILNIINEQAEMTPFQATLFAATVSPDCELDQGGHQKSTKDARWVTLRELVQSQGNNPDHLYWTMVYACLRITWSGWDMEFSDAIMRQTLGRYFLDI